MVDGGVYDHVYRGCDTCVTGDVRTDLPDEPARDQGVMMEHRYTFDVSD